MVACEEAQTRGISQSWHNVAITSCFVAAHKP